MTKATAIFGRATDMMKGVGERKQALAQFNTATANGFGVDQKTLDLVVEERVRAASPEEAYDTMLTTAREAGRLPTELRTMLSTAGSSPDNPNANIQALSLAARAVKDLKAGKSNFQFPENPLVHATVLASNVLGMSEEEAATYIVGGIPNAEEAKARQLMLKKGQVMGKLNDPAVAISYAEDTFDQSWFWDPKVKSEFIIDYQATSELAYLYTGNEEFAGKLRDEIIKSRWGYSAVSGNVMKQPPENHIQLSLPELHPNIGQATRIFMYEELKAAGLKIPLTPDAKLVKIDGKIYHQNTDERQAVQLNWDSKSDELYKEKGIAEYGVSILLPNGIYRPTQFRISVPTAEEMDNFPTGRIEDKEYMERLRATDAWANGRTFVRDGTPDIERDWEEWDRQRKSEAEKEDLVRQIVDNEDGTFSSELSVTVHDPRDPDKFINIPSMYNGQEVSEEKALQIIEENGFVDPETGREIDSFNSVEDAVLAAKIRSDNILNINSERSEPTRLSTLFDRGQPPEGAVRREIRDNIREDIGEQTPVRKEAKRIISSTLFSRGETKQEFKNEVKTEIRDVIQEEITPEVKSKIKDEMIEELKSVGDWFSNLFTGESPDIKSEETPPVKKEKAPARIVSSTLFDRGKPAEKIKEEIRDKIEEKIEPILPSNTTKEIRDEIIEVIELEIEEEITREIRDEIQEEIEANLKEMAKKEGSWFSDVIDFLTETKEEKEAKRGNKKWFLSPFGLFN